MTSDGCKLHVPSSEVGSGLGRSEETKESSNWRAIFEQRNATIRALVEALQVPQQSYHGYLPEFDPSKADTDARSWCATADLYFAENPPQGGQLLLEMSKVLNGEACTWLLHIAYQGMTWSEFKVLFAARFILSETLAGTLINLHGEKPSDNEPLSAYASRLLSSLSNRWKDSTKEELAVATVLAHISQFDSRVQRLAFTTNITSRDKLQQELSAISWLKRKMNNPSEASIALDVKRTKLTSTIKCFNCGKTGHRQAECRSKLVEVGGLPVASTMTSQAAQHPTIKPLVCIKCGKPGHIAIRCTSGDSGSSHGGGSSGPSSGVRRLDVQPPSGTMDHRGSTKHEDVC